MRRQTNLHMKHADHESAVTQPEKELKSGKTYIGHISSEGKSTMLPEGLLLL